ncbi:hypothetical protein RIF29_24554 [Crotalaria pallida]|uniref:Uncharacterized protein n=1 Tax=Crotalaria pallida TaxID=3830 RepID=A0AAN9EMG2_CROPI
MKSVYDSHCIFYCTGNIRTKRMNLLMLDLLWWQIQVLAFHSIDHDSGMCLVVQEVNMIAGFNVVTFPILLSPNTIKWWMTRHATKVLISVSVCE